MDENKTNYKWHLPNKDILDAMYQNKDRIGGFASYCYWSSSEDSSITAWEQDFYYYYSYQHNCTKDYRNRVRPVRALQTGHKETERIFTFGNQVYQVYPNDFNDLIDWKTAMEECEKLN